MYTDKTLTCRDCGQEFIFSAGEQEFFASRGLMNEPGRCPACRAARKSARPDSYGASDYSNAGGYDRSGGYERRERQMYPAICSACGKETQVPFQPRPDRPVYCSDCFATQRQQTSTGNRYSDSRSRW